MTASWWRGWTPAGAVGTISSALVTLTLVGTGAWLCLQGNVDDGLKVLAFAGFSGQATNSLLARTRPDPAATVDQPASVTATPLNDEEPRDL